MQQSSDYCKLNTIIRTFTNLLGNLADDKLMAFFYFFPIKQVLTFHANCTGDNLHRMSNPLETICIKCQNLFSGGKIPSKCHLLNILYRELCAKTFNSQKTLVVMIVV